MAPFPEPAHSPHRLSPKRKLRARLSAAPFAGLACLVFIVLSSSSAKSVLINSGDGTGNVTAPFASSGFERMAIVKNLSAVYLKSGWLLTAYHVGIDVIELGGITYDFVPGSRRRIQGNGSGLPDLALIKLAGDPGLPDLDLASETPAVGSQVIMIGHGQSRGSAISWGGLDGWNWNFPFTIRWGTNRVSQTSIVTLDTESFWMEFDSPQSPSYTTHEAQSVLGDSGGGVFYETGGEWILAGIMFAATSSQNQPGNTSMYTNATVVADMATYRNEILSIINVPDCSNGLDDDLDGTIDAPDDAGCSHGSDTSERSAVLECDNGLDDDGDGLIDHPADPECTSPLSSTEEAPPACFNGIDDDGDGAIDAPEDPGCDNPGDDSERSSELACDNGLDDDLDGWIDYPQDPECASPSAASEAPPVPAMSGLGVLFTLTGLATIGIRFATD